ncbi:MAG TPA: MBL fold metallo-hydrolase [Fulvivirga sp.]|nr:MBL fold metallo-hydrolase [Fulvivirga sp.]
MIQVKSFTFNPFLENSYLLFDETKEGIIIDPGCYEKHEQNQLLKFVDDNKLKIVRLLNTHCHIDHVFGNYFIKNHFNVDLEVHPLDEATLKSVKLYAPNYGFQNYQEATVDKYLNEGDIIEFGNSQLDIMFVPGHAPGHVAFYNTNEKICIGGDVLFRESIGRTDLPGGDHDVLIASIHNKMFKLSDDTVVHCGHGPSTTIGHEKKYNPFCAINN